MKAMIRHVVLLVRDQEEALRFYRDKLGFFLSEDTMVTPSKRWITLLPTEGAVTGIVLAQAKGEEQDNRAGNQTGGKVLMVLHTQSFEEDVEMLRSKGIRIVRGPSHEPWGKVVVFSDLYGNLFDLVQPSAGDS
ncbi:MAG: hypothetical protein RL213_818 [Bacteroidota bacterium]|jgi:catechol 2,3-dioxygenase-like lactoylglutathione lyase family enzyme